MLLSGKGPMSAFFYKSCLGAHGISSQQQNTDLDSYLVRETQWNALDILCDYRYREWQSFYFYHPTTQSLCFLSPRRLFYIRMTKVLGRSSPAITTSVWPF